MQNFKTFFQYLKDNSIVFEFRTQSSEILINRKLLTFELRRSALDSNLNIFELDNIIVFF